MQSPDCNLMDYAILALFERESLLRSVRQTDSAGVNKLNKNMISWENILIEEISKIIFSWKKRLCVLVEEDEGHIEHSHN